MSLLRLIVMLLIGLSASLPTVRAAPVPVDCHGMKSLAFVAHQDDDLLFMNPDIENIIDAGGCVTTVYLTAADRGEGVSYMQGRAHGVLAAYAQMADSPNEWVEATAQHGPQHQALFVLKSNPKVSLIFMRLEDPWLGEGWGSLTPLSLIESEPGASAAVVGRPGERYTRDSMIAALADMIRDYQPTVIRHMDDTVTIPYTALCWRCSGHDHPDHIASARLVREAMRRAPGYYDEAAYVDYPTQERPPNLSPSEILAKTLAFKRYAQDDYRYCPQPQQCHEPLGPALSWVARTYYVVRRTLAPALAKGPGGDYLLFTTGERNGGANVQAGNAQGWLSLGGRNVGGLLALNWPDGRVGVMARDAMGRFWVKVQKSRAEWQGWSHLRGMQGVRLPWSLHLDDGRLAFLTLDGNGFLHYAAGRDPAGLSQEPWTALPVLRRMLPEPAMAQEVDGRVTVFAADQDGDLWQISQQAVGSQAWSGWRRMAGISTSGGLAAMRNMSGQIVLYWRDERSGHLMGARQVRDTARRVSWEESQDFGIAYIGQPAIGMNEQRRIALAVLGADDGAVHLVEEQSLTAFGAGMKSMPAMFVDNGRLLLVSRSNDADQTYWMWERTSQGWQAPRRLEPPPSAGGGAYVPEPVPGGAASAP